MKYIFTYSERVKLILENYKTLRLVFFTETGARENIWILLHVVVRYVV